MYSVYNILIFDFVHITQPYFIQPLISDYCVFQALHWDQPRKGYQGQPEQDYLQEDRESRSEEVCHSQPPCVHSSERPDRLWVGFHRSVRSLYRGNAATVICTCFVHVQFHLFEGNFVMVSRIISILSGLSHFCMF